MGKFIAIEGGDGSGKGTQAKLLADKARELGIDVYQVSFPRYGKPSAHYVEQYLNGKYGASGNDVPADLASLPFAIDRFSASNDIQKHLDKPDSLVIADRYVASNLAHQGTKLPSDSERHEFYKRSMQTEYEILGIPKPDINLVLLVPANISQANVDKKTTRSYTDKKRDIHEADINHLELAKRGYEELCQLYPEQFIAIDCMKDDKLRSINDIHQQLSDIVLSTN